MTPDRAPLWDLTQQSRANLLMALLPMLLSVLLIVAAFLPARRDLAQDDATLWDPPYQKLLTTLVRYAALEVGGDTPAVTLDASRREVLDLLGDSQDYPDPDAGEQETGKQQVGGRLQDVTPLIERRTPADTQRALRIVLALDERSRARQAQARLTLKRNLQALESTMLLAGLLSGLLGSTLILTALNRAGYERHTRERSESQQREALGMAAHELRRPMQALLLATEALRHTDNVRAREKLLRSIEGAADQMARRSELERLDAMYVQMTALPVLTDLTALVARHENMRVRVRRPSGPLLWVVDASQVQQIVENLVENAIKYSDGPITVTLDPPTALWGPVIRVTDHGPGLHPSLHEQAFQLGTRLATHVPGRGLGLPLARRLAQVNRAEITLHDTPGGGLDVRVAFHLPD